MLAAILLGQVFGLAQAFPQVYSPTPNCAVKYTANENHQVDGAPSTGGVYCVGGKTGCTIGHSESYSVEVAITVGAELNLSFEGIGAALQTEVTYSKATSSADTGEAQCPKGPWTCGLMITPSLLQVSGHKGYQENGACIDPPNASDGDYTVRFPVIDNDGNAVVRVEACTCPEQPGAHVHGGPRPCPGPCNLGGEPS